MGVVILLKKSIFFLFLVKSISFVDLPIPISSKSFKSFFEKSLDVIGNLERSFLKLIDAY